MQPDAAAIFAALGDPVRLGLLARLGAGGQSIAALAEGLPITRQAVTKHLGQLETCGLARSVRRGRERLWQGDPQGLSRAQAALAEVAAKWDGALARLKLHLETPGSP